MTNLGERDSIEAVLGGDLEADGTTRGLGVPRSLGTSLNHGVDLVVVGSGEDAALVGGGDGSGPGGLLETNSGGKGGDAGLLDIVTGGGTGEEALVADDGVDVGGRALEQVGEGAEVELGLLEVQVELGALLLALGQEGEGTLELKALGDVVGGLDLGLEGVQGVPCLGDGKAWSYTYFYQQTSASRGKLNPELGRVAALSAPESKQLELGLEGQSSHNRTGATLSRRGSGMRITIELVRVLSLDLYLSPTLS